MKQRHLIKQRVSDKLIIMYELAPRNGFELVVNNLTQAILDQIGDEAMIAYWVGLALLIHQIVTSR